MRELSLPQLQGLRDRTSTDFDAEFIFNHAGGRVPSVLLSTHDVAVVHLEVKIRGNSFFSLPKCKVVFVR